MTARRGVVLGAEAADLVFGEDARLAQGRLLAMMMWDAFKGHRKGWGA
jgi:hypothetical protein